MDFVEQITRVPSKVVTVMAKTHGQMPNSQLPLDCTVSSFLEDGNTYENLNYSLWSRNWQFELRLFGAKKSTQKLIIETQPAEGERVWKIKIYG